MLHSEQPLFGHRAGGWRRLLPVLIAALLLQACGINPVTGERELQLVSRAQEIKLGQENYLYSQQSQGGEYNIDPALSRYVNQVGQRLAKVSDRPDLPYAFVVLNNPVPNAWALPGGKIALNRGLLLQLRNEAELAAVLAHEIVHAAARHGAQSMERGTLMQIGVGALGAAVAGSKHADQADLVVGAAAVGAQLISGRYSRKAELQADHYGMIYMARAGYDPRAAIELQKTFVRLAKGGHPNWLEGLFASHPPSQERVRANIETARSLPKGGRLGAAVYQANIAHLKRTEPAYQAYQEGRKALTQGHPNSAVALAGKAIKIEPREGLFYALKGDARLKQGRFGEAVRYYTQAIHHNDRFFYYYRQRGLAEHKQNERRRATKDLQQSLALLPTASAHYALGSLALEEHRPQNAINHFRQAAHAKSELGKKAYAELVRLELPDEPQKYIALKKGISRDGRVTVTIRNRSPVGIRDIVVRVTLYDQYNRPIDRDQVRFRNTLYPGKRAARASRILALADDPQLKRVRVYVIYAQAVE